MGCSTSKLDDEEVVQLCKDRKRFIKQAIEQRTQLALVHIAYIESLKRVSAALRDYVEGDKSPTISLESSFITPPLRIGSSRFNISVSSVSFSPPVIQSKPTLRVNYLRSGGAPAVSVEERPQPPQTIFRVETYSPVQRYGNDGFFAGQSSPMNPSYFSYSPYDRPNMLPPSPQTSQWDHFWNPFSSLDYFVYPTQSSFDQVVVDDEVRGLRQVREEEGIPDLEEDETEKEETESMDDVVEERTKNESNCCKDDVLVEDDDDDDEDEEDTESGSENDHEVEELQSEGRTTREISHAQTVGQVEVSNKEMAVGDDEATKETPGFTVYVNQRPTSMTEVINDLDAQFVKVCDAANVVSELLESSKAQYTKPSNELSATKMLNPAALIRSASSRSTSSRFLINSSNSKEDGYENGTDFSDESCMFPGSHQATLDRLYMWEKKLYDEVRSGEKVRIVYEKKYKQLRNQDVKGEDPFAIDKTRMAIRNLDTQTKVSLQSVETITKRIEALRDEELQPQLLELLQGFARMWKEMAECHQTQKRTLDEAKILLAGTPSKQEAIRRSSISVTEPHRLARLAANLESGLRNWRACFKSWITSQRSYVHALTGWLLRCFRFEPDISKLPFSPRRSSGTLPAFGLCIQWSRFLDSIHEMPVLEGIDFFAAGMSSLHAQQLKDDGHHAPIGSKRFSEESLGKMDLVEGHQVDEVMTEEKPAEVAIWVLCAGMSVAMNSLSEFSTASAEGYDELVNQWASAERPCNSSGSGT
ncbi:hypothetical protein SLEP1_g30650 [Rubroshorea leprosula]|uniref:Uncharacterized protein n=1 Tax=Rubroshorea leprosula TaxID=152421 RepID=A0AAV5K909_9ROSI|nr:hypothetical protein SLEP1_g30650 [Rubroshorea leprosula]